MKRNRLKITMESRIHGDVYVRFGGERLETYRPKGRQGALRLACYESYLKLKREAWHFSASEHEKRKKEKSFTKLVEEVKKRKANF